MRRRGVRCGHHRAALDASSILIWLAVEHLAHIPALAIPDGHIAQDLLEWPFSHPTLEEGLQTALSDIVRQATG